MALEVVPITFAEAAQYVRDKHRHHGAPVSAKLCVAVADGETVHGVAIAGRPVARMLDDTWTLEVYRVATDGTKNACSMLYRAVWRAARALGYRKVITYTLESEGGGSLRGAGFRVVGEVTGGSWSRKSRPRVDKHPLQGKLRWEADCSAKGV